MKILLATHNNNKKREILNILKENEIKDIELITLEDLKDNDDIEENGTNFKENAYIKAKYGFDKFNIPCIGEDSGLEIDALGGKPGIYSSRYSGLGSEANIDKVLGELQNEKNRKANFIATICYYDGVPHYFVGKCYGTIGFERVGNNGFGYDPIFMINRETSFASMKEEEKNKISHRYKAFIAFCDYIKNQDKMRFIDMHCDTIMELMKSDKELRKSDNMIDLEKLKESHYLLQCFAMFVRYIQFDDPNYSPFEYCNKMIDKYYNELEKNKDIIAPVFKYEDIEKNSCEHKLSSLLTIEEGGVCLGNIEFLRNFYRLGVRMVTLTWNFKNEIASPNIDYTNLNDYKRGNRKFEPNVTDGLTEFGIEVVKEMNRLGMVIDCSHLGDKGFYDVIEHSTKPIVCSHSCARSVCNHVRNMTDDMLLKLKENGGVVGMNFCHDFVTPTDDFSSIKDVVKHINHIKNLIGIDYIGLGSDFDGIGNSNIELKDATIMPQLLDELRIQGYTEEEIDKICYKNVLRVFKANF